MTSQHAVEVTHNFSILYDSELFIFSQSVCIVQWCRHYYLIFSPYFNEKFHAYSGKCDLQSQNDMENVKIQDKNKRDNVKYMHVNGLDYVKSII